jgi:serine/threonine-protein kinase RsbW
MMIHDAAFSAGLDEQSCYQVETAVDEACTNIIEHAYGGENRGAIVIECISSTGILTVKLRDNGKAFDPDQINTPKLDTCLEERPDRGLGLFFIRRWMDSVHFEFSEKHGNQLTMVKRAKKTP